jgi:uncharacterized protein (DUF58 family)
MSIKNELQNSKIYFNLQLLASQVVEGMITGVHKSPFHGFSSEFAEHKVYNNGESTKHIDWKLFARTDKLYTKKYEEETNLRCHLIIDNSTSMHYPKQKVFSVTNLNKIGFSVLASAVLMNLLKKQRDAVGLSVYSSAYDFYISEKGSERHFNLITNKLEQLLASQPKSVGTNTVKYLHEISEKLYKRSLIFFFTDMFQYAANKKELFDALRHLKYKKHEVVLLHTLDYKTEVNLDYNNTPKKFSDLETGEEINLYPENIKELYTKKVTAYINEIKLVCAKYKIKYVPVDVSEGFEKIINTYLVEKQKLG